jgi:ubiquinone/menaquinone biosynthesis C-methylase UbiE
MTMDDSARWDLIHQKTHNPTFYQSHFAEEKEKSFPRASLVVDLGGGTGEDCLYFLEKGHSVILFDISLEALNIAMGKAKAKGFQDRLAIRQLDYGLNAIPVKDNSVDVVYSRIALNYFDAKHTGNLFHDINRILKIGSQAFLSLKSPEDKDEMAYLEKIGVVYETNVFIENGVLRSRFTHEQLEAMLIAAGIKDYKITPFNENLAERRSDHQEILYLDEVYIKKV